MKIKISYLLGVLVWGSVVLSQDDWETAIYAGDNWNYRGTIEELPFGLNILNFVDSNWLNGPGGFGYSDDDDGTVYPPGPPPPPGMADDEERNVPPADKRRGGTGIIC